MAIGKAFIAFGEWPQSSNAKSFFFPPFPLNLFPNWPLFLHVCGTSLLKTLWEKEKLLVMSDCFFSRSISCSFRELSTFFLKKIWNCHLQFRSVRKSKICHLVKGQGIRKCRSRSGLSTPTILRTFLVLFFKKF